MAIKIDPKEEIDTLVRDGWTKEQAVIRTVINLELRNGKGDLHSTEYENRYRERMQKYRRSHA